MNRRGKYKYFTKRDLSMFFYCFELDNKSKDMCTINTPFGLYRYARLAMGIKTSPDTAQFIINKILEGTGAEGYIDDTGFWFNNSFDEHIMAVDKILTRLEENGMKCNPLKCKWAVQETDLLGHWMTPTHIQPMKKKINTILQMGCPTTSTQARSFIGAVNFYKSLYPRRAYLLAPLTDLTGNRPFSWDEEKKLAFKQMKAIIATDCINTYPDIQNCFIFTPTLWNIKSEQQSYKKVSWLHISAEKFNRLK